MSSGFSDYGRTDLATQGVSGATLRMMAVTAAPADPTSVATVADIGNELTEAGYSRQTLANVTITRDGTNHRAVISCDQVNLGSIATGATIAGLWIYRQVGGSPNDASDIPWVWIDTADLPTNGSGVTVTPGASGFATV